jgi:hypothetical protein
MSKTGTGQNVEDMLSSVRRLVSDELPRMPRAEVPKAPPALVLTESQRIEPPMTGHNSRRKSLEDRIAELEAAVAESSDDWEPDGSEDLEQHRPDHIVFRPTRAITRPPAAAPLRLSEPARVDGKRDAKGVNKPAEPLVLVESPVAQPAAEAPAEESVEALQAEVETALTEAVSSAIVGMAEDALTGDEAFEQALASAVGADDGSDSGAKEAPSEPVSSPGQIDIADIRPMISSLIREELQGDLGERITRNVRKLVRQEIQRALTVREVE